MTLESDEETWPLEDWQYEVANGDTYLGYFEWIEHQKDADGPQDDSWIQSTLERLAGPPRMKG